MKIGMIYTLVTAILFVTLEPVSKFIANDVTPFAITFWRFFIGTILLLPMAIAKIKKEKIRLTLKDFGIMTLLGIMFICISMIALQIGVKKADSPSLIAIIFSSNSVFTILFAMLILKEKPNKHKVLALILGILGVIICADFSKSTNLESVLYGVFAALTFSLYTVLTQKYTKKLGGLIQTGIAFFTGSIILLITLLVLRVDLSITLIPKTLATIFYLGLLVTGVGYGCYFKAIEKGGPIMASLAFFIKPILTPFVTLIINGIAPDLKVFIAAICIVIASYSATYCKRQ